MKFFGGWGIVCPRNNQLGFGGNPDPLFLDQDNPGSESGFGSSLQEFLKVFFDEFFGKVGRGSWVPGSKSRSGSRKFLKGFFIYYCDSCMYSQI